MSVFYRKYRVKSFKDLIGQEAITRILLSSLKTGNIAHAYLFTGPRGTGKTSTARILAKALNCIERKKAGEPCNKCMICKAIDKGNWVDLIEIDAASNRGIEEIRSLKEGIGFIPSEGKYKVYIIDEVHMLTKEAFNALLKTLEEPPAHVIFILATTEVNKIPLTIISRCQRFDFKPGSIESLQKVLKEVAMKEEIPVSDEIVKLIALYSEGGFRDALGLLQKAAEVMRKEEGVQEGEIITMLGLQVNRYAEDIVSLLTKQDAAAAIQNVEDFSDAGGDMYRLNTSILKILKKNIIEKVHEGKSSDSYMNYLTNLVKLFTEVESNFKYSSLPELLIEVAIINAQPNASPTTKVAPIENRAISNSVIVKKTLEKKKKSDSEDMIHAIPVKEMKVKEALAEGECSLEEVGKIWERLLVNVRSFNHHITAFLTKCNFRIEKGGVCILVPSEFAKERLEEVKSRKCIEDGINQLLGKKVPLSFAYEKGIAPFSIAKNTDSAEGAAAVKSIISAFI